MEMETCYKHGELLTKCCRQCEIEKFADKPEPAEGLCAICKDDILDNSPTVKVIVHLSCIKPVYPAGPFPGKLVPLDEVERHIRESVKELGEELELPEITIRPAKKEDFKPNAWHKPLPDE